MALHTHTGNSGSLTRFSFVIFYGLQQVGNPLSLGGRTLIIVIIIKCQIFRCILIGIGKGINDIVLIAIDMIPAGITAVSVLRKAFLGILRICTEPPICI